MLLAQYWCVTCSVLVCNLFITGGLPGCEAADLHVIGVQNDVQFGDGLALNKIHQREPHAEPSVLRSPLNSLFKSNK